MGCSLYVCGLSAWRRQGGHATQNDETGHASSFLVGLITRFSRSLARSRHDSMDRSTNIHSIFLSHPRIIHPLCVLVDRGHSDQCPVMFSPKPVTFSHAIDRKAFGRSSGLNQLVRSLLRSVSLLGISATMKPVLLFKLLE